MKKYAKEFIAFASLPIIILIIFGSLGILWRIFDLPNYDIMRELTEEAFYLHGYRVALIAGFAEGLLFFNWYLPGSIAIVMSVVMAKSAGLNVWIVLALITFAFTSTAIINYALGRYGWYRIFLKLGLKEQLDRTRGRVEKHGPKIVFSTYFHPNIGALTATSAGILKLPFIQFAFYSLLANILWGSIWGMAVLVNGEFWLESVNLRNLLLVVGVWIIGLLVFFIYKIKRTPALELVEELEE